MIRNAPTSPTEESRIHTVWVPMTQRKTSLGSVLVYQHAPSAAHLPFPRRHFRWHEVNSDVTCPSFPAAYGATLHIRQTSAVPKT